MTENCFRRFVLPVFIVLIIGHTAYAQTSTSRENRVKAAFVYNFIKFVQWPATTFVNEHDPFIIAFVGRNSFGDALNSVNNKSVRNRKLAVKQFASIQDLTKCHLLFIGASENKKLARIFRHIKTLAVLTVSDIQGFAQHGGIIELTKVANRVRFKINVAAAEKADLKLSSKLLKLAKIVKTVPQEN